jgi:hypothetical protein
LGDSCDRCRLGFRGIQDGHRVIREQEITVEAWISWSVGEPIAEAIEGDDPIPLGENWHLVTPEVAVHDRPCRQQENRLTTSTKLLPMYVLAIPHDGTGTLRYDADYSAY